MAASVAQSGSQEERLYFMDWLRVLAILVVFLVHSMMPFQPVPGVWLIQFERTHLGFTLFPAFAYQWVMPLFFFLAGAGAWFSLGSGERARYLAERARRLLVPLVFGALVFTAFQEYLSLKSQPPAQASVIAIHSYMRSGDWPDAAALSLGQFYPRWLESCVRNPGLGLLRIDCLSSHLWFLAYLWIYSVICLPVFGLLHETWGAKWVSRLAAWSQAPARLLVFCLPTAAIQILLRARFPQHQNWSDFWLWLVYFVYGYLFLSDRRFLQAVERQWKAALATGLACFVGMLALLGPLGYAGAWELSPTFSPGYALYQALRGLDTWAWVVFFLGLGMRKLNRKNDWLAYGREALLPFYILHQLVIMTLAYALFHWDAPILIKYLALAGGAFLITLGVYELLVRRIYGLRVLFGMRARSRPSLRQADGLANPRI